MFAFTVGLLVLGSLITIWVTIARPILLCYEWAKPFFLAIEPFELWVYKKSETILWARFKVFIGLLLTTLTQAQVIDITPLMPLVPDAWEPTIKILWGMLPMFISFLGLVDEKLRNDTTKPIELVALPEAKKEIPEVKAILEAAQETKEAAVAVAEAANQNDIKKEVA
jgi:hypothetical protein